MTRKIRTRIAPSPTGFLHLGTARTALFSWAFARHFGGDFILRIEDTDVARSTQEAVDQIIAAMKWLDLGYDEGPFYQMQRLGRYSEVIDKMLDEGTAYRVTLVIAANLTTSGDGTGTFIDGDANGAADAGASEGVAVSGTSLLGDELGTGAEADGRHFMQAAILLAAAARGADMIVDVGF